MLNRITKIALATAILGAATAAQAQRGPGVAGVTGQNGTSPTIPFLCQTDEGYGRKGSCDTNGN